MLRHFATRFTCALLLTVCDVGPGFGFQALTFLCLEAEPLSR